MFDAHRASGAGFFSARARKATKLGRLCVTECFEVLEGTVATCRGITLRRRLSKTAYHWRKVVSVRGCAS
ncbi:hypothetical protein AB1N83_007576 [Pleurotus pulmonarius]